MGTVGYQASVVAYAVDGGDPGGRSQQTEEQHSQERQPPHILGLVDLQGLSGFCQATSLQ